MKYLICVPPLAGLPLVCACFPVFSVLHPPSSRTTRIRTATDFATQNLPVFLPNASLAIAIFEGR